MRCIRPWALQLHWLALVVLELLRSEFLNELRDDIEEHGATVKLRESIDDQELLLEFLLLSQQKKGEAVEKLQHTISFLCPDIEEVTKRIQVKPEVCVNDTEGYNNIKGDDQRNLGSMLSKRPQLLKNFKKLESTYLWHDVDHPIHQGNLCKLKVKADLKHGDLLQSSNLICLLSFGCDTDFSGVVQLWDVTRSQVQSQMREHEQRVWSIDFSSADSTMLASDNDDGSVKLWSINQGVSVGTIKTKANVCCVQFSLDFANFLAFGSADHRIYYYDLRDLKMPLSTRVGHNKTVSNIKFVDSVNLVSASTDNTSKLWDLSVCASRVIESPIQSFTGHINVKNFVGLSVSDGYIATGSETNEVFIYHKAFPMPAISFKFGNSDPLSGNEVDDSLQFISSVCWRGQSSTLLAANSTGNVKILEMI
ncbi:hypothetical protein RJT34_02245 [Clitoria ternatea]|uniref:Uncharacterized protein n=1 Tax=Clitoria ternatea TaxID=43366 RepID=A0AAN9KHX4_CLITE